MAVISLDRRWPALALMFVLGCSEGGLHIEEPVFDGSEPWSTGSGADEVGELDEDQGQGEADASSGPLDEGPLDEGPLDEGPLDEGPLDEGETGEASPVLVASEGAWRYMTGASIDAAWTTPAFDDLAWPSGAAPLGHGMPVTTEVPPTDDQPTTWFRAGFELADPSMIAGLDLRLRRDDGAIAYLNGVEVLRTNMPSGAVQPSTTAQAEAVQLDESRYIRAFPDIALLQAGTNVLAVEIHDRKANPEDQVIDALLQAVDPDAAPDKLEFRVRTLTYDSSKYGPRHVGAIWIETEDGSFVRTLEVWGDTRREHLLAWRTASDDNDIDAVTSSTSKVHGTHVATWDLTDLDGQPVPPGGYRVRVEFTEDNSNDGKPPGPQIDVAFELGGPPDRIDEASSGDANAFTDLQLWGP